MLALHFPNVAANKLITFKTRLKTMENVASQFAKHHANIKRTFLQHINTFGVTFT